MIRNKPSCLPLIGGRIFVFAAGLFLFTARPAEAAEISVPKLEMASRGTTIDDEFIISSIISADLALSGGYKYSFLLGLSLEAPDISRALSYRNFAGSGLDPESGANGDDINALADRINNQSTLGLRVAKATARDLFGLPLELSYFLGAGDDFCTGDEFPARYGVSAFGTDFKGFFYFPEGIGGSPGRQYNGVHGARGTGFSLGLTRWESFVPILYLYHDFAYFGNFHSASAENRYSADLRFLLYRNWLKLEAFGGVSRNAGTADSFRAGLMAHFSGDGGADFFAQGGVTGWDREQKLSVDNMFFLIEPRLRFNHFGLFFTFFYHPVEYLHVITEDEKGRANINLKLLFGNIESGFSGGIETGGDLKVDGSDDFIFLVSPLCSFLSGGLRWDAKIRINIFEYEEPKEMLEMFIGVRTAF